MIYSKISFLSELLYIPAFSFGGVPKISRYRIIFGVGKAVVDRSISFEVFLVQLLDHASLKADSKDKPVYFFPDNLRAFRAHLLKHLELRKMTF